MCCTDGHLEKTAPSIDLESSLAGFTCYKYHRCFVGGINTDRHYIILVNEIKLPVEKSPCLAQEFEGVMDTAKSDSVWVVSEHPDVFMEKPDLDSIPKVSGSVQLSILFGLKKSLRDL